MPKTVKKDIWFSSADGRSKVAGYYYEASGSAPFCLVQISHGMCEYIGRYDDFASYLAQNGCVVCGNDHIGHGRSVSTPDDLGYLGGRGGRCHAISDMKTMNQLAREAYPGLPLVLLGHSMGSFFSRRFAADWPELLDGLVISGTGGPNPLSKVGILLTRLMEKMHGSHHRSALVHNMAFGAYLKKIGGAKTNYDWISRDEQIVQTYNNDPLCTFRFTASGFGELFSALADVSSPAWAEALRKDMPVMMIQGDADPVGDYGRGTAVVRGWLEAAGVQPLEYKVYPGGRHEMLNETNRQGVYGDVLGFLMHYWGATAE